MRIRYNALSGPLSHSLQMAEFRIRWSYFCFKTWGFPIFKFISTPRCVPFFLARTSSSHATHFSEPARAMQLISYTRTQSGYGDVPKYITEIGTVTTRFVKNRPTCLRNRRIVLTQEQAAEIFKMKPSIAGSVSKRRPASQSRLVSERFGVSSKTVRDIWNSKTWKSATMHLLSDLDALGPTFPDKVLEKVPKSFRSYVLITLSQNHKHLQENKGNTATEVFCDSSEITPSKPQESTPPYHLHHTNSGPPFQA